VERLRSWSFIDDPHKIGLGQGIGAAASGLSELEAIGANSPGCKPYGLEAAPEGRRKMGKGLRRAQGTWCKTEVS